MSRKKIIKRMKELGVSEKDIAVYLMQPMYLIKEWIAGHTMLSFIETAKVLDLLGLEYEDQFNLNQGK